MRSEPFHAGREYLPTALLSQAENIISRSQLVPPTGRIQPGSGWNFQIWSCDGAGPRGSGANLTNTHEVVFRP